MKKLLLTTIMIALSFSVLLSQVPQAFKYQAVVRDYNGMILADQDIHLKISILQGSSSGTPVYVENHQASTNGLGLVNLEIGRGESPSSHLSEIDWSAGNYFIKIEMDESGGSNFKPMGITELLSVPYAMHSGTAFSFSQNGDDPAEGVPAYAWSLFGNSTSDPLVDQLGTTDAADLKMVTNNIERMRIKSDGDIEIARSLQIGENLTVKRDVFLNSETGATINYGPFTVANLSPTLLSGTLTVDQATDLNSSLNVDGVTDLNSSFNVNNNSPSKLTGTLLVQGDATFNQHVTLDNAALGSTSPFTGALVVNGGVGIGENLNVGGDATFESDVTIKGPLALTDTTPSTSTTTGALTVAGGVGISRQLNVGGATNIQNTLGVTGAATFNNTVKANGQVTISANPGGHSQSNYNDYPLQIEGGNQGLAIKVKGSRGNSNNYISFWDESGGGKMWGRIEGETNTELLTNPEYIVQNAIYLVEIGISTANVVMAGIDIASAASSSTGCAGLGACVTAPIPSLIAGAIAKAVIEAASLVLALGEPIAYNAFLHANIGVTYQSGAGDYAEWLRKVNAGEIFYPGEIVGVNHGRISRNTSSAEKVMVISYNPIVLGNMPEEGKESEYEKVAFMGQVPVKVIGQVNPGDYILPSGFNNGYGIAVNPDDLQTDDYSRVVGIAWSGTEQGLAGMVNVAVGLNTNGLAKAVAKQEKEIVELKQQMNKTYDLLVELMPQLKDSMNYYETGSSATAQSSETGGTAGDSFGTPPEEQKVMYFEVTRDEVEEGYEMAKVLLAEQGIDIENHPFFIKIKTEPGYKEEFIDNLMSTVNTAIKARQKIDSGSGYQTETL